MPVRIPATLTAVVLIGAVLAPASELMRPVSARADPEPWVHWKLAGDAPVASTADVIGLVESPAAGSVARPSTGLPVRGWVVDRHSTSRPDRVEVYDGPLTARRLLVRAQPYVWRYDVGNLLGSSAYKASGFEGTVPPGALAAGTHVLTVAAHFEWIGWWTTEVPVTISAAASSNVPVAAAITAPETVSTTATTTNALPAATPVPDAPGTGHLMPAGTMRVACAAAPDGSAAGIEVTVTSGRPFPLRDQIVALRVGAVWSLRSRYGDDGDLHTLVFWLEAGEYARVRPGDDVVVQYGLDDAPLPDDVWRFRSLGDLLLPGCTANPIG